MSSSLSSLVSRLDYMVFKDDQLIFRCFECKKHYNKDFNTELIKKFENIYEFCNGDINKSILLLRKGANPYKHMDSCERLNETSLPDKEAFYSSLNMEDIIDIDYKHAERVLKYDKNNYVVHIRSLKQVLNHGLILKKVYRVINFNQKAWLKEYIDMNTELRKQAKNDFEKDFSKLMNNSVFDHENDHGECKEILSE